MLRVPVDASQVPDFTPDRRVSVLAWSRQGCAHQRVATFNRKGTAIASFAFESEPESLRVALGPETATPADLRHLQTISVPVSSSLWRTAADVEIPAIQVSTWDWWWWQHWRQNFRVTGRVVDAHGRPLAGAAVSAFDVDAWWWWTAQEQVGTAVTGVDGSFLIEFTRCCGWWPWWWWTTRDWQVDPQLVEKITSFVRQYPGLRLLAAAANPVPSLEVFQPILASTNRPMPSALAATLFQAGKTIDPVSLENVRDRLVEILPRRFPLPVWPWSEWSPWEDCGANLTFRVTESRGDQTSILVNETATEARWDIPACLDVKLTAREDKLCRTSVDWTLVDYLFPRRLSTPAGERWGERSGEILPSAALLRGESPSARTTGSQR
ncbi:MAG TPA: carboxypeptidase-like regulatory domain-containing protein [Acidobacteriaceae bacterium]|nr:carboxypeptidase-like regulatory domain-containing protein [Acidobacteriaceae bacterium]